MISALKKVLEKNPMEDKKVFEEATRCPECFSDKIYVFQDTDGGMCLKCKAMVSGIIRGGLSKMEVMRLRGDLKGAEAEKIQNEVDKKEEAEAAKSAAAARASEDVAKLKRDVAGLGKSQIMPAVMPNVPQREVIKKEPGPSMMDKAKAWLFKKDDGKAATPPPPPPKAAPPPPPPPVAVVKAPEPMAKKETGLPMPGERWTVGPCTTCRLTRKDSGIVRQSKAAGTTTKFLVLDNGYFGCFFCAKKQ